MARAGLDKARAIALQAEEQGKVGMNFVSGQSSAVQDLRQPSVCSDMESALNGALSIVRDKGNNLQEGR